GSKRTERKERAAAQALKLAPPSLRTAQHNTIVKISPRICKENKPACNTAMARPMAQTSTRLLYRPFHSAVPQPC
ncbi:unnamed protein product, partial [Ixodes persulcatus]